MNKEFKHALPVLFLLWCLILASVALFLVMAFGGSGHADLCPGGRMLAFEPPPDITAYEVALVLKHAPRSPICVDDAHPLPAEVRRLYQP